MSEQDDNLVDRREAMNEAIRMVSEHADFLLKTRRQKGATEVNLLMLRMEERARAMPAANPASDEAVRVRFTERCKRAVLTDAPIVGNISVMYEPESGETIGNACRAAIAIAKHLKQNVYFEFNSTFVRVNQNSTVDEAFRAWHSQRPPETT